jgi:hypothetical protein
MSSQPPEAIQTPQERQVSDSVEAHLGKHALDLSQADGASSDKIIELDGDHFFGEATGQLTALIESRGDVFESQLTELTERILSDPFGPTCIDAFKDTDAGQWARVVHEVTGDLADLIPGKQLAIKGSGMDMHKARTYLEAGGTRRSTLIAQFEVTADLSKRERQAMSEGFTSPLHINEIYGAFVAKSREPGPPRQWMLMELVEDAKHVDNVRVALSRGGTAPGFDVAKYPELAAFAAAPLPAKSDGLVLFQDIAQKLNQQLGIPDRRSPLGDLNGNNILEQQTPDGPRYFIIDLQSV